jgi:hypothetical protein
MNNPNIKAITGGNILYRRNNLYENDPKSSLLKYLSD